MTTNIALLEDRALLRLDGAEAKSFLQGLVTCDMEKLSPAQAQAGALLSPQGKILFDLMILGDGDGYLVETTASAAENLLKRLNFYKLRARIGIELAKNLQVFALWGDAAPMGFDDPRWKDLGQRFYAETGKVQPNTTAEAYHTHRIFHAIPEAQKDYALEETFPHEANFDLLNGVDFHKGCYVGQEVVSRMQHRGAARKRILPFVIQGEAAPRTPILADGIALGQLGSCANGCALGLVRLDRLEEALSQGKAVTANGATLIPLQPVWANFMIAGDAA